MGVAEEKQNLIHHVSDSSKEYGTITEKDSNEKRGTHCKKDGNLNIVSELKIDHGLKLSLEFYNIILTFSLLISNKNKNSRKEKDKVSLWQLFHYSKKWDVFLMIMGSFFAIINGAGWPILAIVFGSMTNTFLMQSTNQVPYDNSSVLVNQEVDEYQIISENVTMNNFEEYMTNFSLYYVYIGIAVFVASIIQILSWLMACERQVYIIRQEFFYQVLRHEIAWFDKHQSGELTTRLNDDLERIREGIGDKFSMLIQYASTFLAGFVVGFIKGWQLTLVIMSMTPLLTLSSAFLGK
ncbi:ATP-dependent translocase ABCB1, partial [Caerostris extrusa]